MISCVLSLPIPIQLLQKKMTLFFNTLADGQNRYLQIIDTVKKLIIELHTGEATVISLLNLILPTAE